jgi:hypothetical protein
MIVHLSSLQIRQCILVKLEDGSHILALQDFIGDQRLSFLEHFLRLLLHLTIEPNPHNTLFLNFFVQMIVFVEDILDCINVF